MTLPVLVASSNPISHVAEHPYVQVGGITLLSNHIVMMLLAAVLTMLILPAAVRLRRDDDDPESLAPRGSQNFFEAICNYLRNQVVRPALHQHTDTYVPYIWTVFFFILFTNLLGMLPLAPLTKWIFGVEIGGTATGNIWVTGTLAVCTLIMIVVNGLRHNGMEYVKHFFEGPVYIAWLIALLEMIGLIAKTFALAVRLFANMMAGHILLAVMLSFIGMAGAASAALGAVIAVPVVLGSVAVSLLELFVAFLQAFIFTFLTTIFIGQAVVIHHGEDEAHAKAAH